MAHLFHPHIVLFLDFAAKNRTHFPVMEYALNGTLRPRYPKRTCLMPKSLVSYVQQLAQEVTRITESDFFQYLLQQTQHLHPDQC
jgi:hypothetical protein